MKKRRFTGARIMGVPRQAEGGMPAPGLCRAQGISSATFYKWRARYAGTDASMMSQMKAGDQHCARVPCVWCQQDLCPLQPTARR